MYKIYGIDIRYYTLRFLSQWTKQISIQLIICRGGKWAGLGGFGVGIIGLGI